MQPNCGAPIARDARFEIHTLPPENAPSPDDLCEAVHEMFHALSNLLVEELDAAQVCLRRAAWALHLHPRSSEAPTTAPRRTQPTTRGGLAPWQARLLKTHIESHLDVTVRTGDLANLVALSAFHFCRVFRVSFGHSPHNYIIRRRIERAQGLMLTTRLPLGHIAAECGFSDQSHFTKLFRKFAGESPGEWRRMRADLSVQRHLGPARNCEPLTARYPLVQPNSDPA